MVNYLKKIQTTIWIICVMCPSTTNNHTTNVTEFTYSYQPKNMLLRHHGIHPKFITETENRIKYCLRMIM